MNTQSLKTNIFLISILSVFIFYPNQIFTQQNTSSLSSISTCNNLPSYFQKIIDLTEYEDFTHKLLRYPNGDYLAIGHTGLNNSSSDGFIMKFDTLGRVHWAKRVGVHSNSLETFPSITNDYPERIFEGAILSDSTAILIGIQTRESGNKFSYAIAINFNGNKLWGQEFPQKIDLLNNQRFRNIFTTSSDRIFLSGEFGASLFTAVLSGYLYEIDKQGNFIKSKSFLSQGSANRAATISEINGDLFFNPVIITPESTTHQRTGFGTVKIDSNLNVLESKRLTSNIDSLSLQIFLQSSFAKDSFLFISHIVRPIGMLVSEDEGRAGLIKYNFLSHEVVYSKSFFDTLSGSISMGRDFHICKDGSVLMTLANTTSYIDYNNSTIEDNIVLMKVSPQGEILWQHAYGGADSDPYAFMARGQNGGVQLAGTSYSFDTQQSGVYLIRTDSLGQAGQCNLETSGIISEDYPLTVNDAEVWTDSFPYRFDSTAIVPFQSLYPIAKDVCCDNLADAAIQFFHPAYPCGDSVGVAMSICNVGTQNLPANYPITIYGQNPETQTGAPMLTFTLGEVLIPDSCLLYSKTISGTSGNRFFAVLGDPGNAIPPYEIRCDFPLTTTEECDYYNNFRSVVIPEQIGIVALDDDYYLVCPSGLGAGFDLVAPPYFNNPIWNDEFNMDTLRAFLPGWYYLEATTPCGDLFRDSVEIISRYPIPELGIDDTTLCQFDTLILHLPLEHEPSKWTISPTQGVYHTCRFSSSRCLSDTIVFNQSGNYQLVVREAPSLFCQVRDTVNIHVRPAPLTSIDTTFCAGSNLLENQNFTLQNDTLLTFQYPFSESCDSTIQYQITILDTSYQQVNLQACTGDSIFTQNRWIAAGENQTFTYTQANGCDSTILVSVAAVSPSPDTEHFLDFCTGDSILVFNNYQQTPGTYSNTFTNINGCDSIVHIILTESPIFQTENVHTICSGQSILIHGQPETQAGFYEALFTAQNGCDSLSFIELALYETAVLDAEITSSCEDENNGSITLTITEGTGPFSFQWTDDNNTDAIRQDLAPDTYALTLTDANGCTSLHAYNVPVPTDGQACAPRWYAPNAFSPNDDGRNDYFTFYSNDRMDSIELLEIFDRRGSLVFRAENIVFDEEILGWDGTLKGEAMNPQVLVWRAVVVDRNGVRESAEGDVTLVR